MDLSTAQQILVIFLSVALGILLLLGIVVIVLVIRLISVIKQIAEKAERVVESAEAVGDVFKRASGPLGLLRFVQSILESVSAHRKSK